MKGNEAATDVSMPGLKSYIGSSAELKVAAMNTVTMRKIDSFVALTTGAVIELIQSRMAFLSVVPSRPVLAYVSAMIKSSLFGYYVVLKPEWGKKKNCDKDPKDTLVG